MSKKTQLQEWWNRFRGKNKVEDSAKGITDNGTTVAAHEQTTDNSSDAIFQGEFPIATAPSGGESPTTMERQTESLCMVLSEESKEFQLKQQDWLNTLDKYAQDYKRLIYSKITAYVYTLDDEKYDVFVNNLRCVYNAVAAQTPPSDDTEKETFLRQRSYVTKFYDHVNLARSQATLLRIKKEQLDQSVKDQFMPALTETSANLTSQLVSLVALFTALSFIVFGGISSLDSIFSVLAQKNNTVLPAILVAIVWAFCMMNLLFLFMHFVLRIMGTEKESSIKVLAQKHPLVFICNYILLSLLLFLGGAYYAWITGIGRGVYDFVLSYKNWAFFFGLVLILAVIVISGVKLAKGLNAETHK